MEHKLCDGDKFVIKDGYEEQFEPLEVTVKITSKEEAIEWSLRFGLYIGDLRQIYRHTETYLNLNAKKTFISGICRLRNEFKKVLYKRKIYIFK